ncbi:pentapeptide repeat-containing protein (plasmid) [Streptomyces sp. NBC_00984]|uniref:pentapeptide repeat-containing protein n=1 Tax=Streptomyces sp. NBC_00984 TaxID=2903700 RepID=UPI002F914532|nr:pentapeptide repeat-containing protein [Streptomyces sp. NBC_00984]
MSTPPPAPSWPYCARGADPATDPVGCRGIHVPGHTACLAHLTDTDRDAYMTGLTPGADIDHRGTPFTEDLLNRLLTAVRDPATTYPHLGEARFESAQFTGDARFDWTRFSGNAWFDEARFSGEVWFAAARFSGLAWFLRTRFSRVAMFVEAEFAGSAIFNRAQFAGDARFDSVHFSGDARFVGVRVTGKGQFDKATFSLTSRWGPIVCSGTLDLSGAVFLAPVTLEMAAREVLCVQTRWDSTATVRLRYASVDLGYAVLTAPVAVTAHPAPFTAGGVVDESLLSGPAGVRVTSVQGVDAANLVLTDTDVSDCLFSGAFHLDQLRLEGRTIFAPPPTGWHRRGIQIGRWTRRRALAEEHHWRARAAGQSAVPAGTVPPTDRWRTGPHHPDPAHTPDPVDVSALYRQLRKAFEDGKNEPGAADFYYGECEMRRHDRTGTSRVERRLLWGYWLLSGYGLRASRALGWLAASMLATIVLLMAFGLPASSPKQEATGTLPPGGGRVTFTIDKQDLRNPAGDKFTSKRFDKALNITLNSVVFRSSGQDLTTAGTYIEMTSRLLEPALLALAVLAIRGRIKR